MTMLQVENGVLRRMLITLFLFSVGLWQLNMPKKTFCNKPGAGIGEEIRTAVNLSLKKFLFTEENKGKLLGPQAGNNHVLELSLSL
jgi:hypothetical protein